MAAGGERGNGARAQPCSAVSHHQLRNLQYAIQFTQGMQTSDADPRYLQASACCKHYVLNSMESTTEPDGESENRGAVNSNVTQQDLLDSYMAPFQDCVEQGKVSGLMCR